MIPENPSSDELPLVMKTLTKNVLPSNITGNIDIFLIEKIRSHDLCQFHVYKSYDTIGMVSCTAHTHSLIHSTRYRCMSVFSRDNSYEVYQGVTEMSSMVLTTTQVLKCCVQTSLTISLNKREWLPIPVCIKLLRNC